MFWGDGWLSGRQGFTKFRDGVDGCISTAEEWREGRGTSGGQKAGRGGAEGGHCGMVIKVDVGRGKGYDIWRASFPMN